MALLVLAACGDSGTGRDGAEFSATGPTIAESPATREEAPQPKATVADCEKLLAAGLPDHEELVRSLLAVAQDDPSGVVRFLENFAEQLRGIDLPEDLFAALATADRTGIAGLVTTLGTRFGDRALAGLATGLLAGDRTDALDLVLTVGNPSLRTGFGRAVVECWARADADELVSVLTSDGGGNFDPEWLPPAVPPVRDAPLAVKSFDSVLRFASAFPDGHRARNLAARLAAGWFRDPANRGNAEVFEQLPREVRAEAISGILHIRDLTSETIASFLPLVKNLPATGGDPVTTNLQSHFAAYMAASSPETYLAWAAGSPDSPAGPGGIGSAVGTWMANDPPAATAWVLAAARDGRELPWSAIVGDMATQQPEKALECLALLPDSGEKGPMTSDIYRIWAQNNLYAASDRLSSLPPGPDRDYAIAGFCRAAAAEALDDALTWAAAVDDPALRLKAAGASIAGLAASDPSAARELLVDHGWPAETAD